ncbi:hypothetical protein [Endozoicomonas sp. ONNA1]|uniref:hypothetical protein n=1 Tax=Endozoicomonas sp. ONNA1 TaxID=2828740 RepID=UPI002147380F|nr:hypothetical protein [Endozoicomonas sp. ONNA1]
MDIQKLKRDPKKIKSILKRHNDGSYTLTQACKVVVPKIFEEKGLVTLGGDISITAIYAIIVEDKYYSISNICARHGTQPESIESTLINDSAYLVLHYDAGSTLITNEALVKLDQLVYTVYDTIIDKGRVPWYLGYNDLASLFDTAHHLAGAKLNVDHSVYEMLAAVIARSPKDRAKYYRHTLKSEQDFEKQPPDYIALRNVQYGASNTTAKLMGSYLDDGLSSALINPSERNEPIEDLLRK